jgi:GntR family transcriptional regulator/MocR family aminotransferase
MDHDLSIRIDRSAHTPLAGQIAAAIGAAIHDGRLAPGARLPSWHDLAVQLGVARGTVRAAYDSLRDQQLIVTAGAAGTRVARQAVRAGTAPERPAALAPRRAAPVPFQVGVPGQDVFPFKTWSRIMGRAARAAAAQPLGYPDPRGEPVLRAAIAAYLGIARGITCHPSQVFIANGYAAALGLALRTLRLDGGTAWVEDPGYASARSVLAQYGVTPAPVPVDAEGIDVAAGVALSPEAALAVVTPGQQAPLGMTLSLARRHALLDWAAARGAWIVEDDYLGELQLQARATPALAARDHAGRVLHIGTFSKTIAPALRVAFLVVPPALAPAVADAAGRRRRGHQPGRRAVQGRHHRPRRQDPRQPVPAGPRQLAVGGRPCRPTPPSRRAIRRAQGLPDVAPVRRLRPEQHPSRSRSASTTCASTPTARSARCGSISTS